MKFTWLLLVFVIACIHGFGQDTCPEYQGLMKDAESFFKKADYRKALNKYNSAKTCSPSKRQEVDEKINQLFEKIENEKISARKNEKIAQQVAVMKENEKNLALKDSIDFANVFIKKHKYFIDTALSAAERRLFLTHADSLRKMGQGALANNVATSLQLLKQAKLNYDYFVYYLKRNLEASNNAGFFENKTDSISDIGYIAYDTYYYWAMVKASQALNLLPDNSKTVYGSKIQDISDSLKSSRKMLEANYWMPDSVIDMPYENDKLFALSCADNQNFVWGFTKLPFEDNYIKMQLRFQNLSVNDFSFTTDSLLQLSLKGSYDSVIAATANYRYMVVKEINYSLKKNRVEFQSKWRASPQKIKLIDRNRNVVTDLYPGDFFFSPDAKFLASWKRDSSELNLYNLQTQTYWKFPESKPVYTMSFASDSKTMLYYNNDSKLFYLLDLTGSEPRLVSSFSAGVDDIQNIDFTGDNGFLKINSFDDIILYNIYLKKIIFKFNNRFVKNIVVSPNNTDVLITCNRQYDYAYKGYFTYRVDMDLNIKDRLYSDCDNYFFSQDGKYIIAYDRWDIMRWRVDKSYQAKDDFRSCIGFKELIQKDGVPFNYFLTKNEAVQLEQGARKFYSIGAATADSVMRQLYLSQSQQLFDRLTIGDAQNIRQDRMPFFHDWATYIRRMLGDRDFYQQYNNQQTAVERFDRLLNSPDSIYSQLLYYAANSNMLLGNLLDSLQIFNQNFIDLIKKEINIREKVFASDPENDDNIYYFTKAFKKLSTVYDTLGWRFLRNKKYTDRQTLFRSEEQYLAQRLNSFPDSFGVKSLYIYALAQMAPGYLYIYASRSAGHIHALDSAAYFADKGLSIATDEYDIAKFQLTKARVHLLRENELDKALALYEQVIKKIPAYKKTILSQLALLREAGASNPNISKAEEFISKE